MNSITINTQTSIGAQTIRIISTVLHHLDLAAGTCVSALVPAEAPDLERYLDDLLGEIQNKPQRREYNLVGPKTEFATCLNTFFRENDLSKCVEAQGLAQRLLRIELHTEEKYGHLNTTGTGHVKKGSFLQFMYREGGSLHYLGVKVEHQSFLDEEDFIRRVGLGESQKIYKACRVIFDKKGNVGGAMVFDTNSKPSVYWWKEFWELAEKRTDTHNTESAIKGVIQTLGPLKNVSQPDYTILRNASIAAFKRKERMNFDDFVTNTFEGYRPVDVSITPFLARTVNKLRQLPSKKGFDSQFELDPAAVPYRRKKIKIAPEIDLSYEEGIPNLQDKIWASKTRDGKNVVVVEASDEAVKLFKFKRMW